ncbi:hypothetical protein DH2020_020558 [Rehmannia glutinosa]|uniref:Protein POLLEN DEFECTIVE IN GUIDANCE 1 n=1 Tax=Rehmannia glutinosa TaxID=99300 RepID=A0ABR0WKQ3_REHGL
MASRSRGRNLSFDVLAGSEHDDVMSITTAASDSSVISENVTYEASVINGDVNYSFTASTVTDTAVVPDVETEGNGRVFTVTLASPFGELRQRNVGNVMNGGGSAEMASEESGSTKKEGNVKEEVAENRSDGKEIKSDPRVELNGRKLEKEGTLDWKKLMAEDPNSVLGLLAGVRRVLPAYLLALCDTDLLTSVFFFFFFVLPSFAFRNLEPHINYASVGKEGFCCAGSSGWNTVPVEKSPMKYFMEEMYAGNSLRSTTTLGKDKERERVYDTIFRLPWRCELIINFGFFVCLDSFLSLLTIMPTRIIMTFWRLLKTRQFKMPSSAELSDFGCFIVLVSGVTVLQQADISLIYHMIRGQGIIKLYVVYNVLEAITLSTCIVAHNNALFAMLVSNNFAEIKSNVFKRYSKDNVQSLVYFDSVERFHISAFVLFVLAQNILEAEGPWFESFISNALVVYICEVMIDIIKHSFIAKFNDIKPIAFSEFLEDLCKQTLNMQPEDGKKSLLTFVPLAPACVVIRVLRPVYAAHLPYNPLPWRVFWILVLSAMTFVMLASLKMLIGMGLRKHARWYLKRCERRKLHTD